VGLLGVSVGVTLHRIKDFRTVINAILGMRGAWEEVINWVMRISAVNLNQKITLLPIWIRI
jgi:hypothetical protein